MLVRRDKAEGVLALTLCRAEKRNALSTELAGALAAALDAEQADLSLKLCVLRGDGNRAFASGGDLSELGALRTPDPTERMSRDFRAVLEKVRRFPVPVIGALNGDALGGGAELALACDIRIAADHSRLGFLQGKLAISTAWGGGIDLFAAVGISRGLRLLGLAEILSAHGALDWGLVDAVAEPEQPFEDFVAGYVAGYLDRPPQIMRAFKALAMQSRFGAPRDTLASVETAHFVEAWVHDDHWRAVEMSSGKAGKR